MSGNSDPGEPIRREVDESDDLPPIVVDCSGQAR